MKFRFSVLLLLLFLGSGLTFLRAQVLEDMTDAWKREEVKSWFSSSNRLDQWVDLKEFPEAYLVMEVPGQTLVFEGERLWFFSKKDTFLLRQVKDLRQEFGKDSIQLTYFKKRLGSVRPLLQKTVNAKNLDTVGLGQQAEVESFSQVFSRQEVRDFFLIAFLIALFLLAGYRQVYPYIFFSILSPRGLVTDEDFSESGSLQKFFSLDILLFVFLVNILTSLGAIMGLIFFQQDLLLQWGVNSSDRLLGLWLVGAIGLLVLTIFKFIGIRITATLFDLTRLEFPHFFYLLRLIVWANLLFVLVGFFYLMNAYYELEIFLSLSYEVFFWMYLLGIGFLFLTMMNRLSFKKYHLFTYLCIAELVPFLILVKGVMVFGQY
ncbi:DUF4271 domain-containing protein [Algoriphagus kandeliae]|uniref:DUF4271 domain-containing protein n=1 Tax=Algoriphagus kandeliae TaxID=2562278 RepID=A0A4Y9QV34_9BACT|nr:DUF4271 domain-containing protein [Algoriphagus kandeliae]TFV96067.1 DUF4271 domain-containing protein [Algoriphagus kandeliae]